MRGLSDREITTSVAAMPTRHLPDGATPQASLDGVRDEVLLVAPR